jgi:hypothetical protein
MKSQVSLKLANFYLGSQLGKRSRKSVKKYIDMEADESDIDEPKLLKSDDLVKCTSRFFFMTSL